MYELYMDVRVYINLPLFGHRWTKPASPLQQEPLGLTATCPYILAPRARKDTPELCSSASRTLNPRPSQAF